MFDLRPQYMKMNCRFVEFWKVSLWRCFAVCNDCGDQNFTQVLITNLRHDRSSSASHTSRAESRARDPRSSAQARPASQKRMQRCCCNCTRFLLRSAAESPPTSRPNFLAASRLDAAVQYYLPYSSSQRFLTVKIMAGNYIV